MAEVKMISNAAHALCDENDISTDGRYFYYCAAEDGTWGTVAENFHWDMSETMPFTHAQLETKANELWAAEANVKLRRERDSLLKACDWTQGEDVPTAIKSAWTTYRQALRDLPANTSSPTLANDGTLGGVTWPTKPE